LVDNFVFDYFMGSFFAGLVVVFFAANAGCPIKNSLFVVYKLGF